MSLNLSQADSAVCRAHFTDFWDNNEGDFHADLMHIIFCQSPKDRSHRQCGPDTLSFYNFDGGICRILFDWCRWKASLSQERSH